MDEGFRLRVQMLSATAFLPQEDIRSAFGELPAEFAGDKLDPPRYFQMTYVGEAVGGARRAPFFGFEIWG